MSERKPASIRQLDSLVDRLAAGVSEERARQLRMVAGMYGRAVGREEMPVRAGRSMSQLFTGPALKAFWELAAAGELRHRAEDRGKPLPLSTLRTVRNCLAILAGAA
ncbi:hypothetical protein, partial [Streptomyces capuensis]|uniref:hypothetical protein n=1 Tax=Streptomyces capuensis TaxID=1464056 RepID=UPI000519C876